MPSKNSWPAPSAQWIRRRGSQGERNSISHFVRSFDGTLAGPLTLSITASSVYHAWLNGRSIGHGPGVCSPRRWYYQQFEIPPEWLRPAGNVLAVLTQHDGASTKTIQGFVYGEPGLLAVLESADTQLVTARDWKCRRAPEYSEMAHLVSDWGTYREYYHGEREDAWREPGYDDSSWETAEEVGPPTEAGIAEALFPQDIPPLEEKRLRPSRVVEVRANLGKIDVADSGTPPFDYAGQRIVVQAGEAFSCPAVVFDLGAVEVGYPEITTSGGDCIYEVWYGETLDLCRLDCVAHPGDPGVWKALQRRAFRFLMVKFVMISGSVCLEGVNLVSSRYDFQRDRRLRLDDAREQQMVDVSIQTLRSGTSTHYEDCPWREQAAWILDARIMGLLNTYLFGNPELNRRSILQAFAIQRANGHIAATGPRDNDMFHHDFPLHLVGMLREHFQHTGDADVVHDCQRGMHSLDAFYERLEGDDGLLDTRKDPSLSAPHLDWSQEIDHQGKLSILNSLYKLYLEDRAFLLRHVDGDDKAADAFETKAQQLRRAVHETFFLREEGLFADCVVKGAPTATRSQQAQYAAIRAGIMSGEDAAAVYKTLIAREDLVQPFGPSFYLQIVEALAAIGEFGRMREILDWYWGEMLDRGATTWWEVFNPNSPKWVYPHPFLGATPTYEMEWVPISTCHGWSGIPGYAIPRFLMGVDLSRAWKREIHVSPGLAGWPTSANYRVRLAGEPLELAFRAEDGETVVEAVALPAGFELIRHESRQPAKLGTS